jgi:GrpB-like predicted nucleotidyltransferase (UPF0157 family)
MTQSKWPAWASEHVVVVDPDPAWAARGVALIAELERLLSPWLRDGIHHVGSTAIPGLPAKPIIDLMAGVTSLKVAYGAAEALRPCAWHAVPPALDQRDWRRFFVKVEDGCRVAHLHLMTADHPRWREQLMFRNRLRIDGRLRREYGELKKRLAQVHASERESYTAGKEDFVARVLAIPDGCERHRP